MNALEELKNKNEYSSLEWAIVEFSDDKYNDPVNNMFRKKWLIEAAAELARLTAIEQAAREALPVLELAMEISMKFEPCGYYCDEQAGHVDHRLFNWAKESKGKLAALLGGKGTEA